MKPTITQALKGAAISAAIAVVLNHIWNQVATNVFSTQGVPGPWLLMLTLSSIIPLLLGGLVYFLLEKYTSNGTKIFIGLALVLTVFSIFGNFKKLFFDLLTNFNIIFIIIFLIILCISLYNIFSIKNF